MYLKEDVDDALTIHAANRLNLTGGNVGIEAAIPSHKLTINSDNSNTLRLIGPDANGHGARLNFGDGNAAYLQEDLDNRLMIYSQGRTAITGGFVGIGVAEADERLEVYGSTAKIKITNTSETAAGILFQDEQVAAENAEITFNSSGTDGNELVLWHKGVARHTITENQTFTSSGSLSPLIMAQVIDNSGGTPVPTGLHGFGPILGNLGQLGTTQQPWARIYATEHYSTNVFNLIFDTYDDLALLNAIEADTVWDAQLQHHVMRMDPATMPAPIMERDTFADGTLGTPAMSIDRAIGLLMGAARQMDEQTRERDARLVARTDMIAQALDVDFTDAVSITHQIHDQGKSSTVGSLIRVSFSAAFQELLAAGQEPLINITPRSWYDQYMVDSVDEKGFVLRIKQATGTPEFAFNWQASAQVSRPVQVEEKHVDDVFHQRKIEVKGDFPVLDRKAEQRAYTERARQEAAKIQSPTPSPKTELPVAMAKPEAAETVKPYVKEKSNH